MPEAPPPAAQEKPPATWIAPRTGWSRLADVDRRAWMAVGIIAAGGAVIGGRMGGGWHQAAFVPMLLVAAMAVSVARAGWGWLRGRSRRARLREGMLSRVESYGGGVYGTGAGITLLVLSSGSLRDEWVRANGMMDFLRGLTLDWWMGFSVESILNAVNAGIWPMYWYSHRGPLALLAVAAAAWAGDALADAWRKRQPLAEAAEAPVETVPTG